MSVITVGPDESDNEYFGQLLLKYRNDACMSRRIAGNRCDVGSEYIRLIEKGRRVPAMGTALKLFEVYSVPFTVEQDCVLLKELTVRFTSRIKNNRHSDSGPSRDELVGRIVSLLTVTDDKTLQKIHAKLTR